MSRKKNPNSFIHYKVKKEGGSIYGVYCPSDRKHGGKDMYIGTVVDKDKGIFYHKNFGYHKFTLEEGRQKLSKPETEYLDIIKGSQISVTQNSPNLILDYGDMWILNEVLISSKLRQVFCDTYPSDTDTLLSLIAFKLLDSAANCYAREWWEGSFARLLYPNARLQSQRLSEFLISLGEENNLRRFFVCYHKFISGIVGTFNILIDSTGLPNDIHFPYTALNNHNGIISNEARLILVIERSSGYPVYFKYVAGNIVDVSTMVTTIKELKEYSIDIKHSILDAGYFSENNIKTLCSEGIPFLTRLSPNKKVYKELVKEYAHELQSSKYAVKYRDRLVLIKRVPVMLFGNSGFAYVAIDIDRRNDEQKRYLARALEEHTPNDEIDDKMASLGMFVLVSSQEIETSDVLPLYYTRQAIEQVFDYCKNDVDLLPLRSHSEDTFRGHLLLSFMASVTYITLNRLMEGSRFCAKGVFHAARALKCNVYSDRLIPSVPNKNVNDIIKHLKLHFLKSYDLRDLREFYR